MANKVSELPFATATYHRLSGSGRNVAYTAG